MNQANSPTLLNHDGRRILLCDDDLPILRAAQFKLSQAGYGVHCARDGHEAWSIINARPIDLLITDLQMAGMTGQELIERVRRNPPTRELPIVMITAKGYELASGDFARRWGLTAMLTKPFSPRLLLVLVQTTLARTKPANGELGAPLESAG
jgi:DNA-binding response OmpR family regulator